jgi:hypothetical protein
MGVPSRSDPLRIAKLLAFPPTVAHGALSPFRTVPFNKPLNVDIVRNSAASEFSPDVDAELRDEDDRDF